MNPRLAVLAALVFVAGCDLLPGNVKPPVAASQAPKSSASTKPSTKPSSSPGASASPSASPSAVTDDPSMKTAQSLVLTVDGVDSGLSKTAEIGTVQSIRALAYNVDRPEAYEATGKYSLVLNVSGKTKLPWSEGFTTEDISNITFQLRQGVDAAKQPKLWVVLNGITGTIADGKIDVTYAGPAEKFAGSDDSAAATVQVDLKVVGMPIRF
jgi:hypothetical protein